MGRKRSTRRSHGQGTVYAKHGKWSISWRETGVRKYAHGYATEEAARVALAKIVNSVDQGLPGAPAKAAEPALAPPLAELVVPWLERRKLTHRSHRDDASRWKKHLEPAFGKLRPNEVDAGKIRRFVEERRQIVNPATVQRCVALLSIVYVQLVEDGHASSNPVRTLPRSTRRLYRPTHDPRDTPFLEKVDHIRRVYQELPEPINVAFAIGALAGLRPGEIVALEWPSVDLPARMIRVRQQARHGRLGPVKDDEARDVPVQDALAPILKKWKLKSGGEGLVAKPVAKGRGRVSRTGTAFIKNATLNAHIRQALEAAKLPPMSWYCGTRHSYASQWVLAGGSLEKLAKTMGHSTTEVTARYSHLRADLFTKEDRGLFAVNLSAKSGRIAGAIGYRMATGTKNAKRTKAEKR